MYDLSPDIFESVKFVKSNEDEAIITLLIKHLFQEIGLPQKYLYLHMKRTESAASVVFEAVTIDQKRPDNIPDDAELLVLSRMVNACEIISPNSIKLLHTIVLDEGHTIQPYVEKFIGTILSKIFKRLKQFIENV